MPKHFIFDKLSGRLKIALQVSKLGFSPTDALNPGSIPGRDTSFDVPESSCLLWPLTPTGIPLHWQHATDGCFDHG